MRNLLFIVLLCMSVACSKKSGDEAVVKVKVEEMTVPKITLVVNNVPTEIQLDAKGRGEFRVPVVDFVYAQLYYGEEGKALFLQKEEELEVSFNGKEFNGTIQFKGKNAPVNEYLNTAQFGNPEEADFSSGFEEFYPRLEAMRTKDVDVLINSKLDDVNPEFVQIEDGRIRYMYNLYVALYPTFYIMLTGDSLFQPDDYYYNTLAKLVAEEEKLIRLKEYQDFSRGAALLLSTRGEAEKTEYENVLCEMKYVGKNFTNDKVKQALIHSFATGYIGRAGVSNINDLQSLYYAYVTDSELRANYKKACEKWDLTTVGKMSPDFEAAGVDGKTYSLKDFKGKYLFIDMWATWCGPCRGQLPYLKKLEEKFKDKNITFLGLSVDDDKAAWEKMVKSGELTGIQLLLGTDTKGFQKAYNINGIPHFILIDPEGKVVNNSMMRPSSEGIEKVLNALPGI